ncbi:MAG: hypothetical protein KJO32_09665, partial [Deltaproteobacteria bacterium]|nr:hypothetical protein [Deltaproteobacteria bacterium]
MKTPNTFFIWALCRLNVFVLALFLGSTGIAVAGDTPFLKAIKDNDEPFNNRSVKQVQPVI